MSSSVSGDLGHCLFLVPPWAGEARVYRVVDFQRRRPPNGLRESATLTVQQSDEAPELSEAKRLAVAVLLDEPAWPLVDTIVETMDRPDLPTYAELLAALRGRVEMLAAHSFHTGKDFWDQEREGDRAIKALVARCEGVPA